MKTRRRKYMSLPDELAVLDIATATAVVARELRERAGLSVVEVARRIKIAAPNYSRIESGKHTPTFEGFLRLSYVFAIPVDLLVRMVADLARARAGVSAPAREQQVVTLVEAESVHRGFSTWSASAVTSLAPAEVPKTNARGMELRARLVPVRSTVDRDHL